MVQRIGSECGDCGSHVRRYQTNFGGFIAIQNVLTTFAPPPGVISISYGESEDPAGASFNAYIDGLYRLSVLRGVSV